MLYVNGKLVDLTNKDKDYQFSGIVKDYHKTISELKERHGDQVEFMTPSHKVRLDKITKIARKEKPYSWPYRAKVVNGDSVEDWVYSSTSATLKDGKVISNDPNYIISRGSKVESLSADPDKIFFLTKTRAFQNGRLFIYDSDKEADKLAEVRANEEKLRSMIYSDSSPLFTNPELLKMIASKWGVSGVDNSSPNVIKNALFDKVNSGEGLKKRNKDARGIKDFLADCGGSESVQIGSAIQTAIDKEVLTFDRVEGSWKLSVLGTDVPVVLMSPGNVGGDVARERLMDYLQRNKQDYTLLQKVINGEAKVEHGQVMDKPKEEKIIVPSDITLENIWETDANDKYVITYQQCQKALKALGSSRFGGSQEEVRTNLQERLEEVTQNE